MIKFFRQMRQNQLSTGKTGIYFKYALGEIVLVVIGILIALSINNWNEQRKLAKQELSLLEEVKTNLETTLINFETDLQYNQATIAFYHKINDYVAADLPYNNELDSAFAALTFWSSPYAVSLAYKTLQTKGIDMIKNQSLKNELVTLYDVKLVTLVNDIDKSEWNLDGTVVRPFFAKHVRRMNDVSLNAARPNDFEKLKKNDEFLNILNMLIRQRLQGIVYFKDTMITIEKVIQMIDDELQARS